MFKFVGSLNAISLVAGLASAEFVETMMGLTGRHLQTTTVSDGTYDWT